MIAAVLVILVAGASPWAFGAAEPLWWGIASAVCLLAALPSLLDAAIRGPKAGDPPRDLARLTLALPAVALLGLVPIPMALRRIVSPAAAGVLENADPSAADGWRPISLDAHATIGAAVVAAACAAVFWVVLRAARDERSARVLRVIFVAAGAALAVFGLWHRLFHYDQLAVFWGSWRQELPDVATPFGPYVNRNHFAGAMLIVAGVATGPALTAAASRRYAAAAGWSAAALTILVALGATTSRGAIVGLAAGGIALVAASRRTNRLRVLLGLGAAAVVVVAAMAAMGLLGGLTDRLHLGLVGRERNRFAVQWDALRVFAGNPLFGTGAGTFASVYPPFQTVDDLRSFSNAHGDWPQFLMETGLVGAAFVAAAAAKAVACAKRAAGDADPRRWLVLAPAAGCFATCVHGLFETNLHLPANALLFASALSLAFAASFRRDAADAGAGPSPLKTEAATRRS